MKRPLTASALLLILAVACQCSDLDHEHAEDSSGLFAAEADSGRPMSPGASGSGAEPTTEDEPIDVSRFMGAFHNESDFIPFGREVKAIGDPTIANLEIRPDGTASMTTENCDPDQGVEISWRWEALAGPALKLVPGRGEEALRFMGLTDLESVHATLGEGCDLVFEIDGQPLWAQVYRPGRACWVNRCDGPGSMVHIDYCDGEAPPPCE